MEFYKILYIYLVLFKTLLYIFATYFYTMKKVFLIILILAASVWSYAIDLYRPSGARSASMGRACVCIQDLWGLQNNPAGTALLSGWQFGLYYENQWMLKETAFKHAAVAKGFSNLGCIGLNIVQFGGSQYNENLFGVSYARAFGPYLQMGLRVDGQLFHWGEDYPNQIGADFALGVQSQLTDQLRLGACLFHPIIKRLNTFQQEELPVVMRFGLSYMFISDFVGHCEIEYDNSRNGFSLRSGMEYVIYERFCIRAGMQHNPNLLSFGAGYRLRGITLEVAAQMHQLLGAAVQVGISYKVEN